MTSRRLIVSQPIASRRLIVSQLIASRHLIASQLITSRRLIASQPTVLAGRYFLWKTFCHTFQPQPSRTIIPWLAVRNQPTSSTLPYLQDLLVCNPSRPFLTPVCRFHLNQTFFLPYSYMSSNPTCLPYFGIYYGSISLHKRQISYVQSYRYTEVSVEGTYSRIRNPA